MNDNNGDLTTNFSKKFPKQPVDDTFIDNRNSHFSYRRRSPGNGEHQAFVNDRNLTNAWIVDQFKSENRGDLGTV